MKLPMTKSPLSFCEWELPRAPPCIMATFSVLICLYYALCILYILLS